MTIPIPTLSTFGWVTNPSEKIDFALTHMFYSDKFQTSIYGKNVTSIQWILEENTGNLPGAVVAMRQAINNYLSRYYDSANVEVTYQDEDPENSSSKVLVTIAATVAQDGVEYQVSRLISVVNGRFKEFVELNNTTAQEF